MEDSNTDVTGLLLAWGKGDRQALDRLVPAVYNQLRRIAAGAMQAEKRNHPLQATALVHEAYMRLVDANRIDWRNRDQFFRIARTVMTRILIEMARPKKSGAAICHIPIDEALIRPLERPSDWVALDDAMRALREIDPRKARVVESRYFMGYTAAETAEMLCLSVRTVEDDFRLAKAYLYSHMMGADGDAQ